MITADTITDEQLTNLFRHDDDDHVAHLAAVALREVKPYRNGLGLGKETLADLHDRRRDARARCAEILNARAKAGAK